MKEKQAKLQNIVFVNNKIDLSYLNLTTFDTFVNLFIVHSCQICLLLLLIFINISFEF